jgi:hypothetical protein
MEVSISFKDLKECRWFFANSVMVCSGDSLRVSLPNSFERLLRESLKKGED